MARVTPEYQCPECGEGCYTIRDNSDAPIPIHVPPSLHDDEGKPTGFCPHCDEELTPDNVALKGVGVSADSREEADEALAEAGFAGLPLIRTNDPREATD